MSTTTITQRKSSREIFGFMAFAMIFSIIGLEIKDVSSSKSAAAAAGGFFSKPVGVFLGGTVATAILVLLADTGETGRQLGVGIAGITLVSATLVNGAPVWNGLNKLFGSQPTTPSGSTTPTAPSTAVGRTSPTLAASGITNPT